MTRRPVAVIAVLFLATCLCLATRLPAAEEAGRTAVILRVADAIGPATADYVVRGLAVAAERKAALVVLRLDTPGGLDGSMRAIIKAILDSPVPVVTWVSPSGARRSEEHTSELQSLMRISYAVFCLKKKTKT